jgi:hypothetical protein
MESQAFVSQGMPTVKTSDLARRAKAGSSRQKLSPDRLTSLDILQARFYSSNHKKEACSLKSRFESETNANSKATATSLLP